MQKLNSRPTNNITPVHRLKGRIRAICDFIDKNLDARAFERELLELEFVISARINQAAKSITVNFTGDESRVIEYLKYAKTSFLSSQNSPSKTQIYRSCALLGASYVFKSKPTLLKTLSILNSAPLFSQGLKEFKAQGIKSSKTAESLAVGISLARGDMLAANGTNLLLSIGEFMEESAVHKTDDLLRALAKPTVDKIWVQKEPDLLEQIDFSSVNEGDIVVVNTGEIIAVDGYIVDGNASINQSSMTGEAQPIFKSYGDRVISGTVVIEGNIKIWAELVGESTSSERIKEYISASLNQKSSATLKATKLADNLVPATLSLATLSYLINRNYECVASVLQADYSCALKLATPTAFKTAISCAGKMGMMIKGAKAIEAMSKVDTVIFDKTGTITLGDLSVTQVCSFDDNFSDEELLNMTASAEEHYFHPVAKAIVEAAKKRGFHHINHDEVEFIVAHGIKTNVNSHEVIIGSRHFLQDDEGIDFSKFDALDDKRLKESSTILFIGYNSNLIGAIGLRDEIRHNAKEMIASLRQNGVTNIIMLSGDTKEKAGEVARSLGFDRYYGECLPTHKAQIIQELKSTGKTVAFVGDGINDAPSLSCADVGISMHKGAHITKAVADIALLKDDIMQVAIAKELANKTMKRVKSNFNATIAINSAILLGATFGRLSPIKTALFHNGTTIGLLLNSMKSFDKN